MGAITTADLADFYLAGLQQGQREGVEAVYAIGNVEFDVAEVLDLLPATLAAPSE